jgi:hypothetical protein
MKKKSPAEAGLSFNSSASLAGEVPHLRQDRHFLPKQLAAPGLHGQIRHVQGLHILMRPWPNFRGRERGGGARRPLA